MENDNGEYTQIKVKSPRDLFSIIPYALGYQPQESLLVICIRQAGGLGMIARSSLSDLTNRKCCLEIGKMIARNAKDDDTARAFIIIYCQATDEFTLHGYKKQAKLFADALGNVPTETWIINAASYYRVDCDGNDCCPTGGFPVSELENTEASAALVFRGYAPARSREDYLRLPNPPEGESKAAQLAEKRFAATRGRITEIQTWRQKAFATWQNALELVADSKTLSAKVLGVIGAALTDTTMRDAVLLSCLPDGLAAAKQVIEKNGTAQQTASDLLAGVVGDDDSSDAPIPPPKLLIRDATTVLEAVAAHASEPSKPGTLTLLAFLAWWTGDGTRANTRVKQALAISPDYPLAVTLAEAVENHLQPGWIRSRHRFSKAA